MKLTICTFLLGAAVVGASLLFASAIDTTFDVNFDTSTLEGAGPLELAFLLTDGSGLGDGNTTVTLNNFAFGAGGSTGSVTPDSTGGVSGDLATGITLTDTSFFNLLGSQFVAGSNLSFQVGIVSSSLDSPTPDLFQFVILDATGSPLPTTDPSGQNLLLVDNLDSSNPVASSYGLVSSTPEPSQLGFILACLAVAGLLRKRWRNS
jgi:hypothetical protein